MARKRPLKERFDEKYDKTDSGCWEWAACRYPTGYGAIKTQLGKEYAHRVSYELHVGPIPDEVFVCHRCDNPPCVNPSHLFLGTHVDNMRDRDRKGRARGGGHGPKGENHPRAKLTEENVITIRRLLNEGSISQIELAARFGVRPQNISCIKSRKSWGWLEDE